MASRCMQLVRAAATLMAVTAAGPVLAVAGGALVEQALGVLFASGDAIRQGPAALVVLSSVVLGFVWLWLLAAVAACLGDVVRHGRVQAGSAVFRPRMVRVLVSVAVGSVVASGPAVAHPVNDEVGSWDPHAAVRYSDPPTLAPGRIDGLLVPDRPTGIRAVPARSAPPEATHATRRPPRSPSRDPAQRPARAERQARSTNALWHRVVRGDTLWSISEDRLPRGSTTQDIARAWHLVYAKNRSAIGDDPDLLHPGTRLRIPDRLASPTIPGELP